MAIKFKVSEPKAFSHGREEEADVKGTLEASAFQVSIPSTPRLAASSLINVHTRRCCRRAQHQCGSGIGSSSWCGISHTLMCGVCSVIAVVPRDRNRVRWDTDCPPPSGGHGHDGTTQQGPCTPLLASDGRVTETSARHTYLQTQLKFSFVIQGHCEFTHKTNK